MTTIEDIYAKLPSVACKGLCWNSCGPIDMSTEERERIIDLGMEIPLFSEERSRAWHAGAKLYCPALKFGAGPEGQVGCSVYEVRPLICRMWGVGTGEMACPHGCETTGTLSNRELVELIGEAFKAGGHHHFNADDIRSLDDLPDELIDAIIGGM